jgi:hypothetical protein
MEEENRKLVTGYKLLDGDWSLNSKHGRVHYPIGEWVTVPGNGVSFPGGKGLQVADGRG